jgi:uroporphyrinogen decarboxylase
VKLLDALACQNRKRPPIWIMRQAGRYLPSYKALRARYPLIDLFHNSHLAAEVTLLPLKEMPLDAAILFSDILMVLELFGCTVHYPEGKAPMVELPSGVQIEDLQATAAADKLSYVKQTIQLLKPSLNVPLIGFCGGPFTVASYLIEKNHRDSLSATKKWLFTDPHAFHQLLKKITAASIDYLKMQEEAGVDVIQIFDSWAHVLGPVDFRLCCLDYLQEIMAHLSVPVILFCRGSCLRLAELAALAPAAISFDWQGELEQIAGQMPRSIAIQGNLDPDLLRGEISILEERAKELLLQMQGHPGYIFNLGHGILPDTPVDNVKRLVDLVTNGCVA